MAKWSIYGVLQGGSGIVLGPDWWSNRYLLHRGQPLPRLAKSATWKGASRQPVDWVVEEWMAKNGMTERIPVASVTPDLYHSAIAGEQETVMLASASGYTWCRIQACFHAYLTDACPKADWFFCRDGDGDSGQMTTVCLEEKGKVVAVVMPLTCAPDSGPRGRWPEMALVGTQESALCL